MDKIALMQEAERRGILPPEMKAALDQALGRPVDNLTRQTLDPTGSFGENAAAGVGKAIVDTGRGVRQIASNVPGLNRLDTFNPQMVQGEIDESKRLDAGLMKTGGGLTGNIGANVLATLALPAANTFRGAAAIGGGLGAVQPVASDESRVLNTAVGAGAGALGKAGGDYVAQKIGARLANANNAAPVRAAANAEQDATFAAARPLGFVVPPGQSQSAGSMLRMTEGMSNKINMQQTASLRNQEAMNKVARDALGLPENTPLNEATMQAVRAQAGKQGYEPVENLRSVNWDPEFMYQVKLLGRQKTGGVTSNPADAQITQLMNELSSLRQVKGGDVIADVKNLREMAKANFASVKSAKGDVGAQALGNAQSKAATLLEDLAERNLSLNGASADTMKNFREARKLIAKSYTIEDAIAEGAGNVSIHKFSAALNRGTPLEGDMLSAAKFGNLFHKAAQSPEKMGTVPRSTLIDWAAGAAGFALHPALGSIAFARPAMRKIALSDLAQNSLASPNYGPGTMLKLADKAAWNPALRAAIPGASAISLRDLVQQ